MRKSVFQLSLLPLLAVLLFAAVPATELAAQPADNSAANSTLNSAAHSGKARAQQRSGLTPRQAATQAKARYGGKVLKVSREGNAFRVRLLQKSGRVIDVTIGK